MRRSVYNSEERVWQMQLIGSGRSAEIYSHSAGKVLKLYFERFSKSWVEQSAEIGQAIVNSGVPAPAVHHVETHHGRYGVVFDFVPGVTLWEAVARNPTKASQFGRALAGLHSQVHQHQVAGLPNRLNNLKQRVSSCGGLPEEVIRAALASIDEGSPADLVLTHGDLHPGNVMIDEAGKVTAIDWDGPKAGLASADVARTHYLVSEWALAPGTDPSVESCRRQVAESFLGSYLESTGVAEAEIDRWRLPLLVERFDAGIPEERDVLLREIERVTAD